MTDTNGHKGPDMLDRLIQLRIEGKSYSQCSVLLRDQGFVTPSGRPYTSQACQQRYRPFERGGAIVFHNKRDPEAQIRLFIQVLFAGQSGEDKKSVEWFKQALSVWQTALAEGQGRHKAAKLAARRLGELRRGRVRK